MSVARVNRLQNGAAVAHYQSSNRKLSPVQHISDPRFKYGFRIVPQAPFCSDTAVSIEATCPDSCSFKSGGCYAQAGFQNRADKLLTERWKARGGGREGPAYDEALSIDSLYARGVPKQGGKNGRGPIDLRLHSSGDFTGIAGAAIVDRAVARWKARGGGAAWSYTARWREIPRRVFRSIHVLASVKTRSEFREAVRRDYVPAIVVPELRSDKPFALVDGWRVLPCPNETRGTTCVQCRMCLGEVDLRRMKLAIGFGVHGPGKTAATQSLVQLKLKLKEVRDAARA